MNNICHPLLSILYVAGKFIIRASIKQVIDFEKKKEKVVRNFISKCSISDANINLKILPNEKIV